MELTTKFPAPARYEIATIALKLALILCLLILNTEETYKIISKAMQLWPSSPTSFLLVHSWLGQSSLEDFVQSLTGIASKFFNETFPRIVASGITMYLGVCCVYVGSVHLIGAGEKGDKVTS